MSDTLVLDMSTQSEGAAAVFTKRDWISILDNQNQNYQGNQCVIDTSQLANSNKYMNYREAYLTIPLVLTLTQSSTPTAASIPPWATETTSPDFSVGLKNWYGSIIHSFTCDLQGTTIIQQTPYIGLWNSFKLMTSLSLDDVRTQGSLIGFYPDTASVVTFNTIAANAGIGTCNNQVAPAVPAASNVPLSSSTSYLAQSESGPADMGVNVGLYKRILAWNFDPLGRQNLAGLNYTGENGSMVIVASMNNLWQSYVFTRISGVEAGPVKAVWQAGVLAVVYLKHLHSFFERIPLLKGIFMKLTLNLNQTSVTWTTGATAGQPTLAAGGVVVNSPLGGVSPLMISSNLGLASAIWPAATQFIYSVAVGLRCLNTTQTQIAGVTTSSIGGGSVTLNLPAYTFNPVFEQSYLSSPIKKIVYTDVYQYQVLGIASTSTFNNLITNGIANIKSVLVVPFYSAGTLASAGVDGNCGLLPIQSPFDPAGGGPTSPFVQFTQFNIQVSGQNAIYNTERYAHEQFVNQFKGVNAINGAQTDGLVSGLIGYKEWTSEYSYYYVNCGRMLPIEESVPKSVNVLGTNQSAKPVDLYVFVEYGCEVSIDSLTGARV
jgi:hypothetical protein